MTVMDYGFIGKLAANEVIEIKPLNREEHDYIRAYKSWERCGYTEKKLEWSSLQNYEDRPQVKLSQVYKNMQK